MRPLAPGLLSMTNVVPSDLLAFSASMREMLSVAEPGPNGTTMRMGFDGYAESWASVGSANRHKPASAAREQYRGMVLSYGFYGVTYVASAEPKPSNRAVTGSSAATSKKP